MPPAPAKQLPPRPSQNGTAPPAPRAVPLGNDILDTGVPTTKLHSDYISLAGYGRNGSGKTSLACQFPKPLALLSIDPSLTGGARSVMKIEGVKQFQIAGRRLPVVDPTTGEGVVDVDGKPVLETLWGSAKAMAVCDAMRTRFARGERPFETVVIDGVTSWNDVILQEILGVEQEQMDAILSFGKVSQEQYVERAERMIKQLRPWFALPCNVVVIAQERDHNPPKDAKGRIMGSKLMRPAQMESFFSLDIGDSPCTWIQNACDFVSQLYMDAESKVEKQDIVGPDGKVMQTMESVVFTGAYVRRLRMSYHVNFAARARSDYKVVPEYVEGSPEEMYADLARVARGERAKSGKYPT